MKNDDPKLTAYALGELPASDRAEIERTLREQPDAADEINETREMAGMLAKSLHAEPTATLAEHQRWAIMRLALAAQRDAGGVSASERNAAEPSWWGRVGVWQTIAACAVFGFGIYAFSVSLAKPSQTAGTTPGSSDVVVGIPPKDAPMATPAGVPEILTPMEMQQRVVAAGGAGLDAAKAFPNGAVIVPPQLANAMKLEVPRMVVADAAAAGAAPVEGVKVTRENERTIISIPDSARIARNGTDYPNLPGVKKPALIGASPMTGNASIGIAAAKPPSDEAVGSYLMQRMKEAESVGQGATTAEFEKIFRADPAAPNRFEMIRCKSIKVDAEFSDARVKAISKPYLEVR